MSLTLAITTYNRYDLLLEAYEGIIDDPRISEVVILDDCSKDEYWQQVRKLANTHYKLRVYRQAFNRGMSRNKADAIFYARNEWVIILDSDNVISPQYLDAIPKQLDANTIYCPEFAFPKFDFRAYSGQLIDARQAKYLIKQPMFNVCMNTCNYVVNRDAYLQTFVEDKDAKGADTISFNYKWLQKGGEFYICPGMQYMHRVHAGSGFMADVDYNMRQAEKVRKLISEL